jgi:hypothetical protein
MSEFYGKMNKRQKNKITGCIVISILLIITVLVLGSMTYFMYSLYLTGKFSLENTMHHNVKENEFYSQSYVINETRGVGFFNYGCSNEHSIMTALNKCNWYMIFADKIDGRWVIDQDSRRVLW